MTAHSRIGLYDRLAAVAIVLAAASCGVVAFVGLSPAPSLVAGTIGLDRRGAEVRVVRDGTILRRVPTSLQLGDRLVVGNGHPIVRVPNGSLELDAGSALEIHLPLRVERAGATARGQNLSLDLNGVSALIDGVARIERGYSTRVAVLRGHAVVETLGRSMPVAALRAVTVPSAGLLPTTTEAFGGIEPSGGAPVSTLTALARTDPAPSSAASHSAVTATAVPAASVATPAPAPTATPAAEPAPPEPVVPVVVDHVRSIIEVLLPGLRRG